MLCLLTELVDLAEFDCTYGSVGFHGLHGVDLFGYYFAVFLEKDVFFVFVFYNEVFVDKTVAEFVVRYQL